VTADQDRHLGDDRSRRTKARIALAALAGAIALCLAVSLTRDPNPPFVPPPGATSDLDLFRTLVDCVRSGESYYDAAHREMISHGYPTRSLFNWRSPVFAWVLASLPGPDWGRFLLVCVVLVTVALTCCDLLQDARQFSAGAGGIAFVGATAWCLGQETYLFTEVWAGLFLALSVATLRRGWLALGISTAVFALFVRELAMPYLLVSLALAVRSGRRREAIGWVFGLALYALFLAGHAYAVFSRVTVADPGMAQGWVRFGGVRFLLATSQANVFLMGLPLWCTAIYLPTAVLGLAAWRGTTGRRVGLTVGLYLLTFTVVGAPFNFYWGFIFAPLLALGLAQAPNALSQLVEEAFGFPLSSVRPAEPVLPST
jgi:hypothetical protein